MESIVRVWRAEVLVYIGGGSGPYVVEGAAHLLINS